MNLRAVAIALNAVLMAIGVWALVRPNQTDVIITSWWSLPVIGAATTLVLTPALGVAALLQPAPHVLRWSAFVFNAAAVVMHLIYVAQAGMLFFEMLVYTTIPLVTCVALWRLRIPS